jgi:hypothetical protein
MKQYSITNYEKAVENMTEHYKEKNPATNENLSDIKTDYNNLFYNMRWNEPKNRFEVVQIDSKQAWIITDTWTGNKYLQSYHTIVSIYFKDTDEIKELGKWSVTTTRHQNLFYRYCH